VIKLPASWSNKKLDELGFVGRGKSKHRPRNAPFLYGGPYPFIQTGDVKAADLYITDYTQTYSEAGLAQSKLWQPDTLCITIAANIAETAILKIKACFPDSIVGFIADPEKSDVRFIKYYIDTIKLRMQNVSRGTTQDNLSLEKLLSFDFLVPPVQTQRHIASILSAYDDLIENNTHRIKILEQMAQAIYREWFVEFRAPGVKLRKATPDEKKVTGKDRFPVGWEIRPYTDVIDVLSGGTPRTSMPEYWGGDIPWFTPRDISSSFYVLDTERRISELGLRKCSSKLYPLDTVFITARGTVGKCVLAGVPMAMSQTSYALVGRDNVPQHFVYLLTLDLAEALKKNATGAVFDTIIVDTFRKQLITAPPRHIQVGFAEVVLPMFKMIKNLQVKNANLRQTRDLLLPRLVTGEISV
jgi:type I restriction enzyme, S subunit